MIFQPELVKGFTDYLPPQSQIREKIVSVSRKWFTRFGFLPTETPIVEFDELLRGDSLDGEDEAISDRYRLKDKGGRNLGLRYEFTFQLPRIFKLNPTIKLPFRRFQIGPNFRDEPTRTGRLRQFTQCDIDIIGDASPVADAECLAAVSSIFAELGIKDYTIQLNNRKLLNAILDSVRVQRKASVMRVLDKFDKIGEDAVKSELKQFMDTDQVLTLFKLLDKDLDFFAQNLFEGAEELASLLELCESYDVKAEFNPFMIRGLAYYSGNIVEFVKNKRSLAGGGRYDGTVGKFINRPIPAVGISFSLEALMGLCADDLKDLKVQNPQCVIISFDQDDKVIKLANSLREENISCIPWFGKAGKALDFANTYSIPYAIFLGKEEVASKKVKLKSLDKGEEELLSEKEVVKKIA